MANRPIAKKSAPVKNKIVSSGKKNSETLTTDKQNLKKAPERPIAKETIFSADDREKVQNGLKRVLQSAGSQMTQTPVVLTYDDLRKLNKQEFKHEISGAIVQFEVNKRRIDVEEMLATGGNVHYTTDKLKKECGCNQKEKIDLPLLIICGSVSCALFVGFLMTIDLLKKQY